MTRRSPPTFLKESTIRKVASSQSQPVDISLHQSYNSVIKIAHTNKILKHNKNYKLNYAMR